MKKDRKSTTPITAANSADNEKNHKSAPPPAMGEPRARVSRASKGKCIESVVLDRVCDGVLAFDVALTPIYVNERAGELLGHKPEDLIGKNLWGEDPESMHTPFAEACQNALETQTVTPFDGYFAPQDKWLEGRVYPSQDGLSVIFTDAAQPQSEEIENRRREERYRILFNSMQEGFVLAEVIFGENGEPADYRILEANAAMTRFLGKSRQELVGHNANEVFTFDEQDLEIVQHAGRVALGAEPFFIEEYSEILNRSFRIHVFSPMHGQFASLFSDITEAKRMEQALQTSEDKFSKAFHLSPSPMAIMRAEDGQFIDINQSLLDMFEMKYEQVIGRNSHDLGVTIRLDERETLTSFLKGKGDIRDHELTIYGPSGRIHQVLLSVEAIEIGGIACALVSAVDITERKRAEEKVLDISKFPAENPNPVMRFTRDGELLYANQAAARLIAFWQQHGQVPPAELRELLPSLIDDMSEREVEIEVDGQIFSCLMVPIQDTNYVNLYCRDITGRKQAEESLRALINQTTAGIARIHPDGTLTFVNQAFCEMLGYSESELIGKTIWEISHPDDAARGRRTLEQMLMDGGNAQIEKRFIRKNGSILWVSVGTSSLRDTAGNPYANVAVLVDITRRKHAEESLIETARRTLYLASLSDTIRMLPDPAAIQKEAAHALGAHLKASRVAYMEFTPEGTLSIHNGYIDGVNELTSRLQLSDCLPAGLLTKFREGRSLVTADVQNDKRYDNQQKQSHEDTAVRAQVLIPFIKSGEIVGALCVQQSEPREWNREELSLMEETAERTQLAIERAHTDEKLRQSEERLRAVVSQATAGIAQVDITGKFTFANEKFRAMTGYTLDELRNMRMQDVTHLEDLPRSIELFTRMMNEGIPFDVEKRYICKDGSIVWTHNSVTFLRDPQGRPASGLAVVVDITVRKHMQQELLAAKSALDAELLGMNRLYDFSTRLTAASDLQSILEQVLDDAIELQAADFGNFQLYRPGTHSLEIVAQRGFDREFIDHFRSVNDQGSASGRALHRHERVVIEDVDADPDYAAHVETAKKAGYRAIQTTPLFSSTGEPFGVLATHFRQPHKPSERELRLMDLYCRQIVNVIERKQAEDAVRRSEELFASVFRASPIPLVLTRISDSKITDVNAAFCQLFGYAREEILEHTSVELGLIDPEPRRKAFKELAEKGSLQNLEQKARDRTGRQLDVLLSVETLQVNRDPYALTTIIDMTERKSMERALQEERELLTRIFESIPVMLTVYDPAVRMLKVNSQFANLLGWSSDELAGISVMEACYPDPGYRAKVQQFMDASEPGEWMDIQMRTRQGHLLETSWSNIRLSNDMQVGIGIDISERKRYEQSLVDYLRRQTAFYTLTDQLHRANNLKDVFSASLDAILNALQCDRASILLYDEDQVMRFVAWRGLSDEYRRTTEGHSPWKPDEKNAVPICIEDIHTADLSEPLKAVIQAEGIGSLAFIPLLSNGRLIGKFMLYFNKPRSVNEEDINVSLTIAYQLSLAIDRKRSEQALRESQQRLSLTYQQAQVGIVESSPEGRFIQANDEFCSMLGYSHEELLALGIGEVTHENDWPIEAELYQKLLAGVIPSYRIEKRFIRKDGGVIWGEMVRSMVRNEDGMPVYVIGASLNVTERKKKEEALRARTEEIEALMDVSPISIFVAHDPECTVITGNPAGYRLVEMPEDYSGNVSKSAPPAERPTYRTFRDGVELKPEQLPMQIAARTGMEVEAKTLELRFENGSNKFLYAFARPLFDEQGHTRGAIAAMMDITERKQSEDALRQSEERFARFMQHLPGLAWIKDLQGRYVYANSAATTVFVAPQEPLYGRTDDEIFPPTLAAQFKSNDRQALSDEKGIQVIETLQHVDGVLHHSLVSKFPIPGPDGRPALIGGIALDITERIQMEDALHIARDRAETAASRIARLQEITAVLSETLTPAQIGRIIVEHGAPAFGAASSSVMLLSEDSQTLNVIYTSMSKSIQKKWREIPVELKTPAGDAARSGQPVWMETQQQYIEHYPHLIDSIKAWGHQAALAIPMIYKGRATGVLTLSFAQPLPYSPEDERYILILARQGAQAFDRARAEQALHLNATMFETVAAGIYLVRASDGTILHSNPKFDALFGYEPGEVVGKHVSVLNAPGDRAPQDVANGIMDALKEHGSWQGEVYSIKKDGTPFWCFSSISTFEHATYGTVWVAARQDISERRRAEERLRESEEKLRLFIEHAPAAVAMFDTEMRYLGVSRRWLDDFRLDSTVIGRNHYEVFPGQKAEWRDVHRRCLAGAVEKSEQEEFIHADGTVDWLKWEVRPWYNSAGSIGGIVIFSEDISHRMRVEEELRRLNIELEDRVYKRTAELQSANEYLRESEATSRLILESMPDAIIITNQEGLIVHCNTQVENLFGYSPNEVLGQRVEHLLPERFRSPHEEHRRSYELNKYRRIMGLGRDLFGRRKDGSEFPVDVMLSPISNNTTWDVMVTIRDNTVQREAQEALRTSEEKLRTLFEILPVGISFLGNGGTILDSNTALSNILSIPKQHLLKGAFKSRRYIRPDGTPMPPTEFASTRVLLENKTIYNVETGVVKENGEIIWTTVNAAPVQVADVQAVIVTMDITERKAVEEALHRNRERLRVLSRRLVEVQEDERRALARELHDRVGQNLAALNLNLNILRSQFSEEFLKNVGSRLDDSVALVKQILTITRNVMDDLRSNVLDDYGLEAALSEYTERFTQRYGIPVVTEKPAKPIPRLNAGVEMTLLRIAQEALTNVARHAQATQVVVSVNADRNTVFMTIKDNGSGILSWQKANQPGSHGLRIIRERAEAFGGTLQVNSAYKKGTQIEVKIPIQGSL